ncbi:MAG: peptidase M28 [Alphaproteobacteria bacterium RIFCSPHIGHO2_12_FULL_63_12]|nr:MAG: peptidase M28 [Alphaproteobacteria bacterium RIFCSPHIGHO2_12_FULL_63_12]
MRHFGKFAAVTTILALLAGCGGGGAAPEVDAGVLAAMGAPAAAQAATASEAGITPAGLARQIATLASDDFEGRAPTTPGGEKTRAYIAGEYKRLGLEPVNGSYFQTADMVETNLDPAQSYLRVDMKGKTRDIAYKSEAVWFTKRVQPEVSFDASDMVFVGYGIVAPEYQWNDYEGLDVKGKTVIILVNDPGYATQDPALFTGNAMTYYGRWSYKYEEAARQGAAAAIIIHDTLPAAYGWNVVESSNSGPQIDLKRGDDGMSRVKLEGWIQKDVAGELLKAAGLDLGDLMNQAKTRGFRAVAMEGLKASAKIVQTINRSSDANVIGVLKGAEAPDEYMLFMAHWDHLGVDPAAADGEDAIYNGAVDNATGTAAILEIAGKFAAGPRPRRSVLFAAVTAEESGLLGSAYMAENPPVPLKDIVGGINIDALAPTPPARDIVVVGYGASGLDDILKDVADAHGKYLRPDSEPEKGYFYRSDHISFAKKGVPMLYADSGIDLVDGGEAAGKALGDEYREKNYHQPTDEYSPDWDLTGMAETAEILYEVGAQVANSSDWPNWRDGNEFRAIRDASREGK